MLVETRLVRQLAIRVSAEPGHRSNEWMVKLRSFAQLSRQHDSRVVVDADAFELTESARDGLRYRAPVGMITVRAGIVAPVSSLTP